MTVKRMIAIAFIFACTALGWFILGASVHHRTGEKSYETTQAVTQLWGGPHAQFAPIATFREPRQVTEEVTETNDQGEAVRRRVDKTVHRTVHLPLERSRVEIALDLDHRRKGLLWYDTYTVGFEGRYRFRAPEDVTGPTTIGFSFPARESIYDDFTFRVAGRETPQVETLEQGVSTTTTIDPGEVIDVEISYRSRGLDRWSYLFAPDGVTTVSDFELSLATDFDGHDFPPGSIAPSRVAPLEEAPGHAILWRFDNLVSGKHLSVDLPNLQNPGPLAARITFFAPVSLLFFVTVLVILGALRYVDLHPMHYFFLSAAFFAFHLLLAYLVDHVDVHVAFVAASAVSVGLVVTYLRLVCGIRRAVLYAGGAQLVFLVLFSYAFFFEGYTGLTITVGAIVTLFVLMQLTGRVDWDSALARGTTSQRVTS